ncbi:phage gp6-like head-tail connector protein [Listeria monocytogenes]|nr:phage gp6-like head-tail connector protein [Listeria monocytogenes]EAG8714024.1 phage gp6-like head-tail connector protein [Listeria monocytogenes]EAG8732395.1 phage gp6-like head-tail connector protein [Listeria monocytogenes]
MTVDIDTFKSHIHFEDGMDDSLLGFYLEQATIYVKNSTDEENEQLILLVASVFYQFRISEKELESALNALTPFFVAEVYNAEDDKST